MLILIFILTGCANEDVTNNTTNKVSSKSNNVTTNTVKEEEKVSVDYEEAAKEQMKLPEAGETIAVIHVKDFGDIKVKFFEEVAPKAVENFVTHAKNGYYNGVTFHRVINEFMIQGGDPEGTGMGGESIWGEEFEEELSEELVPYRGSLCMASRGLQNSPSLGSQFFITQANYSEEMMNYMQSYGYPTALLEQYEKYGGYLSLYQQYTVFGQVYEGMDIVDRIATVETDDSDKPVEDVIIESIDIKVAEQEVKYMKIILKQDIKGVGKKDQIINVADRICKELFIS